MIGRILGVRVGLSGNHSADEFTRSSTSATERVARRDAQEASKRVEKAADPWEELYYLLEAKNRLGDETSPYVKVNNEKLQQDMKQIEELVSKVAQDVEGGITLRGIPSAKLLKIAEYLESLPGKKMVARTLYKEVQRRTEKDLNKDKRTVQKKHKIGRI